MGQKQRQLAAAALNRYFQYPIRLAPFMSLFWFVVLAAFVAATEFDADPLSIIIGGDKRFLDSIRWMDQDRVSALIRSPSITAYLQRHPHELCIRALSRDPHLLAAFLRSAPALLAGIINERDAAGNTVLHQVCASGDCALLLMLLDVPEIDVDAVNDVAQKPIHRLPSIADLVQHLASMPDYFALQLRPDYRRTPRDPQPVRASVIRFLVSDADHFRRRIGDLIDTDDVVALHALRFNLRLFRMLDKAVPNLGGTLQRLVETWDANCRYVIRRPTSGHRHLPQR
jgi:hypothetical protein